MDFSKLKLIITIFLALFQLPPLVFSKTDTQKTSADTLLIGSFVEPTIINPILTHSSISAVIKGIIFDGLIKVNDKMEPNPHLAFSWENSLDGLTWIFHLRRDVRFHDGTELTAEDVKFTFDKINDPSINSPYISVFKNLKAVRVKDRYTVEIHLKNPLPSLPFYLDVGILPKHLLEGKNITRDEFNYHPIGTGPFKLRSWIENEIILKRNEHYFLGRPQLDGIIVKIFPNQSVVWAQLMKKELDLILLTFPKSYKIIEKIPDFRVHSFLSLYYYILVFNNDNGLFKGRKVRLALNYAVNKEKIIRKALLGKGQASSGTIYPLSWAYDPHLKPYPYNPQKALKLLKNEGWKDTDGNHILNKNGKEFEFVLLIVEGDDVAEACALLIQQQLLDIGIRTQIKPLPFPNMYGEFLLIKKFDASLLNILSDSPDRNYAWWHSSQIKAGFNVFSYRNEKVDELLDKGRITLDREKRREIYHQFQREIYDDPPGVFLFWRDYLIGIHKRFRGVRISPAGIFHNINEWYVPKEEQKYR